MINFFKRKKLNFPTAKASVVTQGWPGVATYEGPFTRFGHRD